MRLPFFGRPREAGPVEWLVVGLGNPGQKYALNRHNVGFHVVNLLADQAGWHFDESKNQALLARGSLDDHRVALLKPQTYMNLSGKAVGPVVRFYKVPTERVLVIHDDLDLPLGKLRLRTLGGAGGHNGVASIIDHLGTQQFPRIRVGIGRPPGQMPAEAYVLQNFKPDEQLIVETAYQEAAEAVRVALRQGFEAAMNTYN